MSSMELEMTESPQGVRFAIKVRAGAGRTEVTGIWNGALKLNVSRPPSQGEANRECLRFLAECLGLPKTAVEIKSGEHASRKIVFARGITSARAHAAFMAQSVILPRRKPKHA
ncbi:MAG: DUF167 domain-containing protein [candidate division FCPU426 bacterium]